MQKIVTLGEQPAEKQATLEKYGGKYIMTEITTTESGQNQLNWYSLLVKLKESGLRSVMVEGGGHIINSLLSPKYQPHLDMVIVTIAPTWLGQGGVMVPPERCYDDAGKAVPVVRLADAKWYPFGEDVWLFFVGGSRQLDNSRK